jgi:hypothetical protein
MKLATAFALLAVAAATPAGSAERFSVVPAAAAPFTVETVADRLDYV